jgi:putative flippase GtrA
MWMLLRLQLTSIIATLADFIITVFLTEFVGLYYVVSNVSGAISGGIVNFSLNRKWVFKLSGNYNLTMQIIKYSMIWVSSIVLNTIGVYLVTEYLNLNYVISKLIVSLVVALSFNQVLQKQFVFKQQTVK